ncbi:MAG: hypothetical protein HS126_24680 [Anaerolineales bacterium]|nr:hypothetical protein [Anaerolineales bacterium]
MLDVERINTAWTPLEVGLSQVIDLARRCDDWLVVAGDSEVQPARDRGLSGSV